MSIELLGKRKEEAADWHLPGGTAENSETAQLR
jgi:ADP-ribose pyrophosphatase YjhB (NUDIX family)